MRQFVSLKVDQDWLIDSLQPGDVLRFIARDYDKDRQKTDFVFERIGAPLPKELDTLPKVVFT